jgi:uncharacterized protein YecE (DUF72 family)
MIRVGIGGWTYAPWRGAFYPPDLRQAEELAYASRHLTAIEINGTFYRTQSAASFRKWHDQTPDDFVFAVKGHRNVVNRSKLAEAKDSIDWFFSSGILELGPKLGPILWQLAPFKHYHAEDIAAFFAHLPRQIDGRTIWHAIEPRHRSFQDESFVTMARDAGIAIVKADSEKYPTIEDLTGEVVYARLQNAKADEPTGYSEAELDAWARQCRAWEAGEPASSVPLAGPAEAPRERPVFAFMINGAKERAPAAAMALIDRLKSAV